MTPRGEEAGKWGSMRGCPMKVTGNLQGAGSVLNPTREVLG